MVYFTSRAIEIDPMNVNHNRNLRNTEKSLYNCGGYALGTFSWYCPYERGFDPLEEGWETDLEETLITHICVSTMLREFPNQLRQLWAWGDLEEREESLMEQLQENEYLVCFRISSDGDFHYAKKQANGVWYHKMGARQRIERTTFEEIHEEHWLGRYDGSVVYFAKTKN